MDGRIIARLGVGVGLRLTKAARDNILEVSFLIFSSFYQLQLDTSGWQALIQSLLDVECHLAYILKSI